MLSSIHRFPRRSGAFGSAVLALSLLLSSHLLVSTAGAQAPLLTGLGGPQGFGTDCLHPNDDGSSREIDLTTAFPSGLRFFSGTHTRAFVNTNGNITFSGSLSTFTPNPFPVASRPMIAPYWADVDIRDPGSCSTGTTGSCLNPADNGVWWDLEPGRMIVTWDDVGYFSCHTDKVMRFQLILTAVPTCGGGSTDFDVEFRFNTCEWETGDASSGSGGFGGTEAQSGFDAGNGVDFVMLAGSRMPGIANRMCTDSNLGEAGVWRFEIRSGAVVCPDAGVACETGLPGVCEEGVTQCVGTGTECQPVVPSSPERCDALDNDCDGMIDEGAAVCEGASEICDRGVCTDTCFEGGCGDGQTCTGQGRCIDTGCEGVECPSGERCSMGTCGDACAGVRCPFGQSCRSGRCLDLCADIECDPSCSACSEGECIPRCDLTGQSCPPGDTCTAEGLCEPTECLGATCPDGEICMPGGAGCVDACAGVVCPSGEECAGGVCDRSTFLPDPDAGMPDGGAEDDGGLSMEEDAGSGFDAGPISGEPPAPPPAGSNCICSAPGSKTPAPWIGLALVGLAWVVRRRR